MSLEKIGGSLVLQSKHAKHIHFEQAIEERQDFKSLFMKAISQVNQDQALVGSLTQKAIVSPSEVDAHDVTIAMAKANMSLTISKAVAERVVRAYQDIINMR